MAPEDRIELARGLFALITMELEDASNRSSGWNRKVIEDHLGAGVADSLRLALMPIWRRETPLLRHERPLSDHEGSPAQ
jgi:hypothetical protein